MWFKQTCTSLSRITPLVWPDYFHCSLMITGEWLLSIFLNLMIILSSTSKNSNLQYSIKMQLRSRFLSTNNRFILVHRQSNIIGSSVVLYNKKQRHKHTNKMDFVKDAIDLLLCSKVNRTF